MRSTLLTAVVLAVAAAASCDSSSGPVGNVPTGSRGGAGGANGLGGASAGSRAAGGAGGSSASGGMPPLVDGGGAGNTAPEAGEPDASVSDAGAVPVDGGSGSGGAAPQPQLDSGVLCGDAGVSCGDGSCLPASMRCNGVPDCNDLADEEGCSACIGEAVLCDQRCVPAALRCDGNDDCTNGADENAFFLLEQRCGSSGCHGDGSNLGDFAASEERAAAFVGVEPSLCEGVGVLIDPSDPPASFLVQKLGSSPACGSPMPLAGDALTQAEVACIERWIGGL